MILKKLQTGATTVIVTKKEYDEYISQGYTYVEDVEVAIDIDEAEEENVRFKIEDDKLYWKYESDFAWTEFVVGGGGDTYKVKVDETGTADYLDQKVIAGNNVTVTKAGDKLVIASTASGGSGVTVYADLAAIKAVDTTSYTTVETVQVASLGLYKFQPSSTLTGDDINVITPTTGSSVGRWIKQSIDIVEVASNTGKIWSDKVEEPRMAGKKIKLLTPDSINKKILAIGSSVMLGYTAATYLQTGKSYTISEQGNTNWTSVGASSNAVGTVFTATGAGTGTGTAKLNTAYPEQLVTKLNTEDAGWTVINNSIAGNSSSVIYSRMWIDGLKNNPGLVLIGACPNNDSLDVATTVSTVATALEGFEKGMDKIIKACKENGLPYYIVGVYPKTGYTALSYVAEKQLNIALQKKYGFRYINIYNILDNGSGAIKTYYDSGDGIHLNENGHTAIMNAFPSGLIGRDRCFENINYNKGAGITLGSDTTTAKPIESTTVNPSNSEGHTFGFDFKKTTAYSACVLAHENGSREININIDSNGYIGLFYQTTQIITTTVRPTEGWNRLRLVFNRDTNFYKLYLNQVLVGTSSVSYPQYLGYFTIGGGLTPANNAVGVEFRNVAHWTIPLSQEEIIEDFNNEISKSCLSYFNPLNTIPTSIYESYAITSMRRLMVNSSLWTLGTNEMDNIFTNTEKAKLANSISGTFTTADGKTITITGGMVTSIV